MFSRPATETAFGKLATMDAPGRKQALLPHYTVLGIQGILTNSCIQILHTLSTKIMVALIRPTTNMYN